MSIRIGARSLVLLILKSQGINSITYFTTSECQAIDLK